MSQTTGHTYEYLYQIEMAHSAEIEFDLLSRNFGHQVNHAFGIIWYAFFNDLIDFKSLKIIRLYGMDYNFRV